jgi:hypothetical protein
MFWTSHFVPLRTRKLVVVVTDLDFDGSDLVMLFVGLFGGVVFPASVVVRRGSESFYAVMVFGGESRWTGGGGWRSLCGGGVGRKSWCCGGNFLLSGGITSVLVSYGVPNRLVVWYRF